MANTYFVMREPGQADQILVWDTRTLSIGRGPENDLVIEDDEISRKHALLTNEGGAMEIGDYRTANGTFVNGTRVEGKTKLVAGAVIGIGKLQLELRQGDEHPAQLGHKLQYASQLKMAGILPAGSDGDCTMLGMMDTQQGDDPFVIEPARSTGEEAFVVGSEDQPEFQMRQLDEELGDLSLELDDCVELVNPISLSAVDPLAADPVTGDPVLDGPVLQDPVVSAPGPGQSAGSTSALDPTERMRRLKSLHESGLITDDELAAKRAEILSQM